MLGGVLSSINAPQERLSVVMIVRAGTLAQRRAARSIGGGDPGQHGKRDGDARVLEVLLMLAGGDLRHLEKLDRVLATLARMTGPRSSVHPE
jgi:hypothetical protein